MGFLFAPECKKKAEEAMMRIMGEAKSRLEAALPFAMDPVVYDFTINNQGTCGSLLDSGQQLPGAYLQIRQTATPAAAAAA